MVGWRLLLALALTSCLLSGEAAFAQSTDQPDLRIEKIAENTYLTYGFGPTEPEARVSAIRNGLQFATQQAVNVEITVEAGEVIKDSLYSTMNAQVDRFTVTNISAVGDEIYVQAELEITDSAIKATVDRYKDIGLGIQSRDAQQSSDRASDVQAGFANAFDQIDAKEAETIRNTKKLPIARELYSKLFEGWPERAYDVNLFSLEIDKKDPTKAELTLTIHYDESWLTTFKQTRALMGELMSWAPAKIKEWQLIDEEQFWLKPWRNPWTFRMQRSCVTNEDQGKRNCVQTPAYHFSNGWLDHWRWLETADFSSGAGFMSESPRLGAPVLGQINGFVGDIGHMRKKAFFGYPPTRKPRSMLQSIIASCVYDESGLFMNLINLGTGNTPVLNPGLTKSSKSKPQWTIDHSVETSTRVVTWTLDTDRLAISSEDRYASFFSFHVRSEDAELSEICAETFEP